MRKRRVAYVLSAFPKLSESFIANELAELRRRDVEVLILALARPDETLRHEVIAEAGLDERTTYERAAFAHALATFSPDLIHAHFATEPAATAAELASTIGVPYTFTAHGHDIYRRAPEDFAARAARAGAVVTVSEANARWIADRFGVPRARLHVIPSGVDTGRFTPNGGPASPPLIVCVARLAPVKNLALLLAACASLRDRGVDFHAVIVGEGRMRAELEATIARLALASHVRLVGAATQEGVLSHLRRAAAVALTSDSEGLPVSLMEAGACGVPAVATAVGGVPELIEDGVTGLLAKPGDPQSVAAALERVICDRALAACLGDAARRRVETLFSLASQVDRLLSLWKEVVV
jgi:glycosyltransferase involved in cell wall biosynthesis